MTRLMPAFEWLGPGLPIRVNPSDSPQADPHAAYSPPEEVPVNAALRVLVVEDNPVNQMLATRVLQKKGHSVVVAGNGRQALEALAGQKFDVVLMDVNMPEMDGLAATAAIRAREEGTGRRVPIVALTAQALAGDRERCLAAGMDAYLSKPVRGAQLLRAVAEAACQPGSQKA
jgi:CheY-like chemotaxis protein